MARRKKSVSKPTRDKILEYGDWKAGDRCYTLFNGESRATLCDVVEFHPKDNITPSVSVVEVTTGKTRVAAIEAIAEDAKEAKRLGAKWWKWYGEWQVEQARLERIRRRKLAAAEKKKREAEEKANQEDNKGDTNEE